MTCPRCDSPLLSDGTCRSLICYLDSNKTSPLDAFLAALAAMPSFEREKVMDELREKACLFCGGLAGCDCMCWQAEEVVQA